VLILLIKSGGDLVFLEIGQIFQEDLDKLISLMVKYGEQIVEIELIGDKEQPEHG